MLKLKISTRGRYALEAVVDLAVHSPKDLESLKNIADRLNISKNYLEQIFVLLRQQGIVNSIRGAQGGYYFAKDISKITAGEVIRTLEGPLSPVGCLDDEKCQHTCGDVDRCVAKVVWSHMMAEIDSVVDSVTIKDIVEYHKKIDVQDNYDYFI